MARSLTLGGVLALALAAGTVYAQAPVIGQPDYYGQINLGDVQQPPELINPQPIVIQRDPGYDGPPVYLHVPPGYEQHWDRYCHQYNACDRPVYFVRNDWYNGVYAPEYRRRHGGHDEARGEQRDDEHMRSDDRGHEDSRGEHHDDDHR